MDKDELIHDLKQVAVELGKAPTIREFREIGPHSPAVYKREFGSWNEAIKEAGFEPNQYKSVSKSEILEDIQRVADALEKTPTLDEMAWHGKYSKATYQNKLDSYVGTLQKLGLEPTEKQYRFSSRPNPNKKQGTQNTRYVREHGPTFSSELPGDTGAQDKQHGLAKFSINTGKSATPAIYYLFNEHDPERVIRTYIEANPAILENRTEKAIVQEVGTYGKDWSKAIRKVLDEMDVR